MGYMAQKVDCVQVAGFNLSIIMSKQDSEHGSQYLKHSTTCKGNLDEEMT